jgi:hypothetical protein
MGPPEEVSKWGSDSAHYQFASPIRSLSARLDRVHTRSIAARELPPVE